MLQVQQLRELWRYIDAPGQLEKSGRKKAPLDYESLGALSRLKFTALHLVLRMS